MHARRGFLAGLAASALTPSLSWSALGSPAVLSAALSQKGQHLLVGLATDGSIVFRVPLPERGHAAAAHPFVAEAVAIARRPGRFAKVLDCATGTVVKTLTVPEDRHFYGHGTFSADGRLLFTTENDTPTGSGRIGVWDRSLNYARIGEFASGGIGPHEILRLPSGALAVANGGIRTHPDSGREKLNLDTMRANLTLLDEGGKVLDRAEVADDMHLNSLRHIAAKPNGDVVCGFQWQGDPFDAPPLVAVYAGAGTLHPAAFDAGASRQIDGYIGSVSAFGQNGFAVSAPRGGRVITFNAEGEQNSSYRALDACGLARAHDGETMATDGNGFVYRLTNGHMQKLQRHRLAFDNHLVALF
ncbi:MAG: DUF1513 domain-containing protein [Pseudomonadota bacterium]